MDIEIWDGGLQEQEIEAINKIKAAFTERTHEMPQEEVHLLEISFKQILAEMACSHGRDMPDFDSWTPRKRGRI